MKIDNLKVIELSFNEKENISGGIWEVVAGICGIVYLAGEIAESAGRAYKKHFLDK